MDHIVVKTNRLKDYKLLGQLIIKMLLLTLPYIQLFERTWEAKQRQNTDEDELLQQCDDIYIEYIQCHTVIIQILARLGIVQTISEHEEDNEDDSEEIPGKPQSDKVIKFPEK